MRCACAHGRSAGLSASILQAATGAELVFQQLLMSAALLDCINILRDAFQCIAQPTTALRDCILSPMIQAFHQALQIILGDMYLRSNLPREPVCCCNTLHSNVLVAACIVYRVRLCNSRLDKKHANAAVHTVAELLRCMHLRMHLTVSTNACACMYANKCTAILKHMRSAGPAMPMPSMQEIKIS